jgi:hypothetical protein
MGARPDDCQPNAHILRSYDQGLDPLSVVLLEMGGPVISHALRENVQHVEAKDLRDAAGLAHVGDRGVARTEWSKWYFV